MEELQIWSQSVFYSKTLSQKYNNIKSICVSFETKYSNKYNKYFYSIYIVLCFRNIREMIQTLKFRKKYT